MKKSLLLILLLCFVSFCLVGCGQTNNGNNGGNNNGSNNDGEQLPTEDEKIHLFILAGQSGGRGKAKVSDLTNDQKQPNYDVDILADGLDMPSLNNIPETIGNVQIEELKPGFGDSMTEFGPELGMGETLASRFPKDGEDFKSVIIKYTACGSTFTHHWYSKSMLEDEEISQYLNVNQMATTKNDESTGPLTNNLYQLIDKAIADLTDAGYEVVIDGAAFVHGEQDAKEDVNMSIYEKALKYFIKDLRAYVGNDKLPVVVTEALTNSAKYSNELRAIQKRVADADENVAFVGATDLYTNTFEPWHFGAPSNFVLGNRIAAEIISLNDTRVVESIDEEVIKVPFGAQVKLPSYLRATFTNQYSGYLKVEYTSTYDENTLGEQKVTFKAKTGTGTYNGELTVNVCKEAYIDGVLNEYASVKKNALPNNLGNVYVVLGEEGLYVAADVKDTQVWTDGELWALGDMGQNGANDDFRVYVTTSTAAARKTICLSAANLLRIYDTGASFPADAIPGNNLVYSKLATSYAYHVTTNGLVNDKTVTNTGLTFEVYVSYEDLGIENPEDIKLCFNYVNMTAGENSRNATNNYLCAGTATEKAEESDASYFAVGSLIQ